MNKVVVKVMNDDGLKETWIHWFDNQYCVHTYLMGIGEMAKLCRGYIISIEVDGRKV